MGWLWDQLKHAIGLFFTTLFTKLPSLIGRVLSFMGIGIFGFSFALPRMKEMISPYILGLPHEVLNYVVYLNVDKAIVVVLSAYAVVLSDRIFFGKTK
ncbi:DUF2523 family protein [Luteibacter sp. PPL554]